MYLSKYLVVDEDLPFKKMHLMRMKLRRPHETLVCLCTPTSSENLFEILSGEELHKKKYNDYCIVGLSQNKDWILKCTISFVDQLYNQKTLEYNWLKQPQRGGL